MTTEQNNEPTPHDFSNLGDLIQRPDGSWIDPKKLPPRKALAHKLVSDFFPEAEAQHDGLVKLKKSILSQMRAYRKEMLQDYGIVVGGKEGNLTVRSVCGTKMIQMTVGKHISFGSELEAAKTKLDQFIEGELAHGSSDVIRALVTDVFKLNSQGRLDTSGIMGLRNKHDFDHPLWSEAMDAIDDAVCRDSSTTYVNFFSVDLSETPKRENRIYLDFAKV